jgi:hypothetical protein
LTATEQEAFEAHYLGCEECFRALRFVEKTTHTMHYYGDSIFAPAPARPKLAWSAWWENLKTWWSSLTIPDQWKSAIPALATYVLLVVTMSAAYYWIAAGSRGDHQPSTPTHVDREGGFLSHSSAAQLAALAQVQPLEWTLLETSEVNPELRAKLEAIRPIYQDHPQYQEAADRLTAIAAEFPQVIAIRLFAGISQLLAHQPADAIPNLQSVLEHHPDHAAAQWYLAQGYLLQGRGHEAASLLSTIKDKQDSPYSPQAEKLLEALNKLGK